MKSTRRTLSTIPEKRHHQPSSRSPFPFNKMTQPLVSIVIPVFNVEDHLRQCLDSVLGQTLQEWECICIDDGSPDSSGAILDEYGDRDARFKIIHQRNRGVSAARNLGIKLASAPYLTFIDSDDWIEANALESLLSAMKESRADMVMCSIRIHRENRQEVSTETPYPPSGNIRDEYVVTHESFSGASLVDVSIWAKLFKMETIRASQIHFAPELKVSEDMEFSTRMLCHSKRVSILRQALYHYRAGHESSIMNNIVHGRMKTSDFINSINAIYHLCQCVPADLKRKERKERITGTLRRALSGKTFYHQIIRHLEHKDRAVITDSTSFPYLNYLRRGKKMTSLHLIFQHLRMQLGIKTRLRALLDGIRNSFQS